MKVYVARVYDMEEAQAERLCGLLDRDRQEKLKALKVRAERNRSIAAGLLLRHAFLQQGFSQKQWQQAKIRKGEYGKPYMEGYPDFHYSLSHSGQWVLCAVDANPVGADIQEMKPWKLNFAKRFYNEEEYGRLLCIEGDGGLQRQTREFYSMWAAKESAVKLEGAGIGEGLGRFVTNDGYGCICDTGQGHILNLRLYDELDGYMACVCSRGDGFPERLEAAMQQRP